MVEIKTLKTKQFNFEINDRVRVFKNSPMYGKNSFHPENMEGTIANIKENCDSEATECPLYIVWDNDTLSANALQNIELVDAERLKDRFTYNLEELFLKDVTPETVDDVLPLLYSGKYQSAVETYYKNVFGERLHCKNGKLRSFDDIYYLFKAYFPEETYASVFKRMLLYNVTLKQFNENNLLFQMSECSTIKRIRYIPFGNSSCYKRIWNEAVDAKQYESITHWLELFKLLGIHSETDLKNWYKKELSEIIPPTLIKKA